MLGERTTLFVERALHIKHHAPRTLYSLTCLAALGGFLFGYDAGVTSAAIVLMRREYGLTSVWQELTVSAAIGAAAVLAVVGGHLNDIIGRKSVVLLASVLFTSGSICVSCAADKYILLVGRLVIGSGIGLTSTTVPMYIAECAPSNVRGRLVSVNVAMIALGQLAGNVVGGLFSFTANGWRYMVGLGTLPSATQFMAFLFMPESPRWLVSIGRLEKAREVLARLRGTTAGVDEEVDSIGASFIGDREDVKRLSQRTIFVDMIRTPSTRRALLLGCGLQAVQQLVGINTVVYYSTVIITMAGIQTVSTAIWWSAATSTVYFLFSLLGLYLVEKIGRRWLTLLSLFGAVVGLAWLGAGFQLVAQFSPPVEIAEGNYSSVSASGCSAYKTCHGCRKSWECGFCYEYSDTGAVFNGSCLPVNRVVTESSLFGRCKNATQSGVKFATEFCPTQYYWTPLVGLLLYLAFFAPGMGLVPWTINSEIYPLWARSAGNGMAASTNWFINLVMSVSFLSMSEGLSVHGTFWMYLVFSVTGLVILGVTLPETKGKDLEEIHGLFAVPWFGKDGRLSGVFSRAVPYQQMPGLNDNAPEGAESRVP